MRQMLDHNIEIYDLEQSLQVMEHSCISGSDYLQFDKDDGLVFADTGKAHDPEHPELATRVLELWHWNPKEGLRKTGPYQPFHPELPNLVTHSSVHYNGLRKLGLGEFVNGLISPDGHTWLLPRRENGNCRYELIDARTGQLQARLAKKDISLDDPRLYSFDAAFTKDGSQLVTFDNPLNPQRGVVFLEWWNPQTGELMKSIPFPKAAEIGKVISVERDRVYALSKVKNAPCLLSFAIDGGYREVSLDEIALKPNLSNPDSDKWKPHGPVKELATVLENGKCIYFRHYALSQEPEVFFSSGGVWRWALVDLLSSQTTYRGFGNEPSPQRRLPSEDYDSMPVQTIIAGRHLVVKQLGEPLEMWRHRLEMWRQRWSPWLPEILPSMHQLRSIDLETGDEVAKVTLPLSIECCLYHPENRSLYVLGAKGDEFVVRQYAYPFRSPWLLIAIWSVGLFVALVLLQECWGRRQVVRKSH